MKEASVLYWIKRSNNFVLQVSISLKNILLLFICLGAGVLLRRTGLFNDEAPRTLNRLIIYFFIPIIAIYQVPKIEFQFSLIWLTISPFLVFGLSLLFFHLMEKPFSLDRETKAVLILTSGISSTSFVGFPVFELLYGEQGLAYGVFLSLGGTIFVFNTLGISTLFAYSRGATNWYGILRNILTFIPFLAFLLGVFLNLIQFQFAPIVEELFTRLIAPFSVIALLSIGMQMRLRFTKAIFRELLLGQFFKLIIAPLFLYLLIWQLFDIQNLVGRICILGAAIGSMNAMSILTAEKGLRPELAVLMPAIGIPLSIPILFLIDILLK